MSIVMVSNVGSNTLPKLTSRFQKITIYSSGGIRKMISGKINRENLNGQENIIIKVSEAVLISSILKKNVTR